MKRGRYIEGSPATGTLRAEITPDGDDPSEGLTSARTTMIDLNAACSMSEEQWLAFVAEVNSAIEKEKRGGC